MSKEYVAPPTEEQKDRIYAKIAEGEHIDEIYVVTNSRLKEKHPLYAMLLGTFLDDEQITEHDLIFIRMLRTGKIPERLNGSRQELLKEINEIRHFIRVVFNNSMHKKLYNAVQDEESGLNTIKAFFNPAKKQSSQKDAAGASIEEVLKAANQANLENRLEKKDGEN